MSDIGKQTDWFEGGLTMSRKPKLVILDDDEGMYGLCRTAFQAFFDVAWSPSKSDFLETVTGSLCLPPDVVITDINSPGMRGPQFLREARKRGLLMKFPVIVWSGAVGHGQELLELGATFVIRKPCTLNELRGRVGLAHFRRSGKLLPMANRQSRMGPKNKPRLAVLDHLEGPVRTYQAVFSPHFEMSWSPQKLAFLEQVKRAPDQAPDVVISNICSPPMNGIRFLSGLWDLGLHNLFPVVVVSAGGRWATAIEYGATEFIRKPFKVQEIRDVVIRAYYGIRMR